MPDGVPCQGNALNFFRPPLIHQKQTGANKVRVVHYQLLSSYSVVERSAGAPGALNFFCPPFIHQKQTGANKIRVIRHQLLSSYSVPGGVPCQGDACRGVLHTPSYHSRRECLRVGGSFVPFRGTYKGAYSIRPYTAGRKKNLCPSGLLFLFSFKKTYTSHCLIPIKKINLCPSGLLFLFSFKKTYASHQPIPIKKINPCPSGLPIPIHFSNLAYHTLCFSFK